MTHDFQTAQSLLTSTLLKLRPTPPEAVPLAEALHRTLAAPALADRDQPAFPRSTRDGFAARAADLSGPVQVIGQVRAGQSWAGTLPPGKAIEIMTGAPIPPGADCVVMIEHVTRTANTITILEDRILTPGENIVPQGAEARSGQVLLQPGTRLGPAEIALLASCGITRPEVHMHPLVAIIPTGDELVDASATPAPHQIRNSNGPAIAALVHAAGGRPLLLPIARDTRESLREALLKALTADLIIFSGGVSMGQYDLVEPVLAEFNADFLCTGVKMQPGKPLVFGTLAFGTLAAQQNSRGPSLFFGLPGNPISTHVTFLAFAARAIRALAGEPNPQPLWALATVSQEIPAKPNITRILPARLDNTSVTLIPWHGSGDMAANARANCYAELLPNHAYAPGDTLRILLG